MFMLLLAVFNGELFVYSGVLRWPPHVGIQWMDYSASPFSLVRVKLARQQSGGGGRGGLVSFSWVDSCMKHTTYHGIISNYYKSSIVQVINRV